MNHQNFDKDEAMNKDEKMINNDDDIDADADDMEVKEININIYSTKSKKYKKGTRGYSPMWFLYGKIQRRRQRKYAYKYDEYPIDCGFRIKVRNI
jgi:hypothetical protein